LEKILSGLLFFFFTRKAARKAQHQKFVWMAIADEIPV
jgi:hypothetical protein